MTARIRLIVLVSVLAYSVVFGPGQALGALKGSHLRTWWKPLPIFPHKPHRNLIRRIPSPEPLGLRAVRFARQLLGVPYRWGGDSPQTGFDCSGFVRFVYAHFGLALPHSSYGDYDLGVRVARQSLRPGDLVFFDGIGHVGMYVGGGRFIHAPHTGTDVQVTSLDDPWYRASYDGARRVVVRHAARRARHLERLRPA
jgi:NlpC/P60 family